MQGSVKGLIEELQARCVVGADRCPVGVVRMPSPPLRSSFSLPWCCRAACVGSTLARLRLHVCVCVRVCGSMRGARACACARARPLSVDIEADEGRYGHIELYAVPQREWWASRTIRLRVYNPLSLSRAHIACCSGTSCAIAVTAPTAWPTTPWRRRASPRPSWTRTATWDKERYEGTATTCRPLRPQCLPEQRRQLLQSRDARAPISRTSTHRATTPAKTTKKESAKHEIRINDDEPTELLSGPQQPQRQQPQQSQPQQEQQPMMPQMQPATLQPQKQTRTTTTVEKSRCGQDRSPVPQGHGDGNRHRGPGDITTAATKCPEFLGAHVACNRGIRVQWHGRTSGP